MGDPPAALGEVHPQVPVLVALPYGPDAMPAPDRVERGAAEQRGDGILVGVGDAEGVERLRDGADHLLPAAELEDVAHARDRLGILVEAVGHRRQRARLGEVVGVQRRHVRAARDREAAHASAPDALVLLEPDDGEAVSLERVERAPGFGVGRAVVDEDDVDGLGLLDRGDRLRNEPPLPVTRDDHGDPRFGFQSAA